MTLDNLLIRPAISWWESGIGIPVVNCGGDPNLALFPWHRAIILSTSCLPTSWRSKVPTKLQKCPPRKKRLSNGKQKKQTRSLPNCGPPETLPFFSETPPLIRHGPRSVHRCGFSAKSKKRQMKARTEADQRWTWNPVNLGERWGVGQQVGEELCICIHCVCVVPKHWFTVDKG